MTTQRQLAEQLFEVALDLKPAERTAFLDRECNGNAELRQEVESLFAEASSTARSSQPADRR